jgi:rhamnose transport system permease protein
MSDAARYQVLDRAPTQWRDKLLRWETILLIVLATVIVFNTLQSPYFLDLYNLSDTTQNFSEKAIVALGMALLILVREIDLSVAAIVALASLAIGFAAKAGWAPAGLFAVGILVGFACGAFNGFLVTAFGLPSIVVTIGTMSLYRGIAQVVLGDQAITGYPSRYTDLAQSFMIDWLPIYLAFAVFIGLALCFGAILHLTAWGRVLYAIGNNPVAARFSGIRVDRIRFVLFAITGALSGLAAALLTARIGSTRPNVALGWELEIVTMVVLGGVSIAGGAGTVTGVVLAVFVLGLTTFGLTLLNVPGIVINVILGCLLIAAIAVPIVLRRAAAQGR